MTFPAEVAHKLVEAALEAGVRRSALFAAAGVEARTPLSYADLCRLYAAGARLSGDSAFGLHVGERTRPGDYGLLGYAASHSMSFGDALERLVALQAVWSRSVKLSLLREGGLARLAYRAPSAPAAEERRHESEQMMAALVTFARLGTGTAVEPVEARFEHGAPADPAEHRRIFACPLVFRSAATEIVFREADLRHPMAGADPKLGALISVQAETALAGAGRGALWTQDLRLDLRAAIARGERPSLAEAARALGLGPRTLQRRLRDEGLSWRNLIDEARIQNARDLLADPRLSLAQIGHRAGFSQVSAFHRAFRRIEGTTPRRHRQALAQSEERR